MTSIDMVVESCNQIVEWAIRFAGPESVAFAERRLRAHNHVRDGVSA